MKTFPKLTQPAFFQYEVYQDVSRYQDEASLELGAPTSTLKSEIKSANAFGLNRRNSEANGSQVVLQTNMEGELHSRF